MLALEDYKEIDWVSDKEFYFALEKYRCEKELDGSHLTPQDEIDEIYREGLELNIEDILDEEDGY